MTEQIVKRVSREIVKVTPKLAKVWLAESGLNRKLSFGHVLNLSVDMQNGLWKLNPNAAIIFGEDGKVYDGQHRLHAVVDSGVTVEMFVDRNVPMEVILTMDLNRNRTVSDIERMVIGDNHAAKKVAVAAVMVRIEWGKNMKIPRSLYTHIISALGPEHVDAICSLSRVKINAPTMAALIYARPVNALVVDELAEKLSKREVLPGVESSILRAMAPRPNTEPKLDIPMKVMRGIQVVLCGGKTDALPFSRIGYTWLQKERAKKGVPVRVVPEKIELKETE